MPHTYHKFNCLFPLLLLLATIATGQGRIDTIQTRQDFEVYVNDDRSMDLSLIVQANVLDMESSLADYVRLGAGISADYLFPRYASVNASYKGTYYSLLKKEARDNSFSQNDLNSFSVVNAGIRLHILDGGGRDRRRFGHRSFRKIKQNGKPGKARFIKVSYPCRRIIGLRGGFYYSNAPVAAHMNADILEADNKGGVRTTDGSVFTGSYYTNSQTTGFYVGVTRIINMYLRNSSSLDKLGAESALLAIYKEMYADVIFANTNFDPFAVAGKQYAIAANTAGSFSTADIGWRVGGKLISAKHLLNLGVNYEIGSRPGVAKHGGYVNVGINMALMK